MPAVTVCCPNPSCPSRVVEGEEVTRELWEATWNLPPFPGLLTAPVGDSGFWSGDISCPTCGEDGVAAEDESGIDQREEELGTRCGSCGVVSFQRLAPLVPECPHCGEPMSGQEAA